MNHYKDYKEDCSDVPWTKFKIVVPTEEDKKELLEAFRHLHYTDCDTQFVTVNQLVHVYLDEPESPCGIVVDKDLYEQIH